MIIQSVLNRNYYPYLHRAIYAAVDGDQYIKGCLKHTPEFIKDSVMVSERNSHVWTTAVRVASIYHRFQNFIDRMREKVLALEETDIELEGREVGEVLSVLDRIKSCLPVGVVREPRTNMDCRKYAVCPWCRFRKAQQIMEALGEQLSEAKQLSFITLTAPMMFMHATPDFAKDYSQVIKGLCKNRDLFFADYVVTTPNWRATREEVNAPQGVAPAFTFNLETTIIGLSRERADLPLPENCISPKLRSQAIFGGVGSGCWTTGRPTKKMLERAMRTAMGFSPALLSPRLDPHEFLISMDLQSRMRATGHGAVRHR